MHHNQHLQVNEHFWDELFAIAAASPNLRTLRLGPLVWDDDLMNLEGLAGRMPSLCCLQLNGCNNISDVGLPIIAQHLPGLRHICWS